MTRVSRTTVLRTAALLAVVLVATGGFPDAAASPSLEERVRTEVKAFTAGAVTMPGDSIAVSVDLPSIDVPLRDVLDTGFELMSSKPVAGTVPIRVTLYLKDGTATAFAATARVRIYDTVLVAARRLNRHEVLPEDAVRLERRDVTNLGDAHFTEAGQVAGQRVKRIITPGTLLRGSDIEIIPVVARGSSVMVRVEIGAVTVNSRAKALEDGEIGELIKVQDLTTGKRLVGTVAGERLVVLDEAML